MSYTFTSLDAATSTGPGTAVDLKGFSNDISACVASTDGGYGSVLLEGSFDGMSWAPLWSADFSNNSQTIGRGPSTQTFPKVRFVRANLTSLAGGTSPAVTAVVHVGAVD